MAKHRLVVIVDLPESVGLNNEDLAEFILDACPMWAGSYSPDNPLKAVRDGEWKVYYNKDKKRFSMNSDGEVTEI